MHQRNKISRLDFRNAIYQGHTHQSIFSGAGIVLTEDFLFCIGIWENNQINGPCLCMFPNQKVMYGSFDRDSAQGVFCYEMGNDCQIYAVFENNLMQKQFVAIFPHIGTILHVVFRDTVSFEQFQHHYNQDSQKWALVSSILKVKLSTDMKSQINFMKSKFSKCQQMEQYEGEQYFIGIVEQGLGIKIKTKDCSFSSVGYYDNNKILKKIGKCAVESNKIIREQGIYDKDDTLVRYEVDGNPEKVKKYYRNYFKEGINFVNKFLCLGNFQKMEREFYRWKIKIRDETTQKIAQELIQDHVRFRQIDIHKKVKQVQVKKEQIESKYSRKMGQVSIQKLKQQLNDTISQRKVTKSPYKQYDLTPAQLKYTSLSQNYTKQQLKLNSPIINNKETVEYSRLQAKAYQNKQFRTPSTTYKTENKNNYEPIRSPQKVEKSNIKRSPPRYHYLDGEDRVFQKFQSGDKKLSDRYQELKSTYTSNNDHLFDKVSHVYAKLLGRIEKQQKVVTKSPKNQSKKQTYAQYRISPKKQEPKQQSYEYQKRKYALQSEQTYKGQKYHTGFSPTKWKKKNQIE